MRNLLLSSAVALALAGPVYAQANPVLSAVEAIIAEANENEANISYASADVGGDNSVTLTDFRMAPETGELALETGFVKLTPSADVPGDVTLTFADTMTITATPPDGTPPFTIDVVNDGFAMTSNYLLGATGNPTVKLVANSLSATGGSPDHPMLKNLNIKPEGLTLDFSFDKSTRDANAALDVSNLVVEYTIEDPSVGMRMATSMVSEGQSLSFTGRGLPTEEAGMMGFFMGGGSFDLKIEGGASTTMIDSNSPELPAKITGSGGAGSAQIAYGPEGIIYRVNFGELEYMIEPDPNFMPLPPMQASMSGGSMELVSPVMPTGSDEDINIGLSLRDLVLSDTVWSMIDPGATIPRDAATLEIDIDAVAQLIQPIFMLEQADNPMEVMQIQSVKIQQMFLNAAGAKVSAMGDVTLDNSGPFPMPNGAIDVAVAGLQGLAEKLVALGFVEQMEVGMAMGMMMAFAQPGAEPDTFTSKIEFKDGGIFANGQPIQ